MRLPQSDLNRTKRYKKLRRKKVKSNIKTVIKSVLLLTVTITILFYLIFDYTKKPEMLTTTLKIFLDILILISIVCITHNCIKIKLSLILDPEVVQPNVNSDTYWVKKDFIIFTKNRRNSHSNKVFISYYKLPNTQARQTSYIILTKSDFDKYNKQLTLLLKGNKLNSDTFFKSVTRKLTTKYNKDHTSSQLWGTKLAERIDRYLFEDIHDSEPLIKL